MRKVTSAADVSTFAGGALYIADIGNHAIRRLGPTGAVTTLAGSGSAGSADGVGSAASFSAPSGVAVDGSGNVYVADSGVEHQRKIFRLAADGTETEIAALPELTENAIAGMTFDAQGNLVFLDRNRSTVRVLLP